MQALLAAVAACCIGIVLPASAGAETRTFLPTGGEQTFTVPSGVTSVHVIAVGGRGGTGSGAPAGGGFGAVAIADLAVTPGQVLYVNVGGNGEDAIGSSGGAGGFNGGGSGGPIGTRGGGGGGASDVRTIPRSVGTSPFSRLVVAAGGGGSGGANSGGAGGDAGEAGANATMVPAFGGQPGTATAGGAGGGGGCAGNAGQLGEGGDGVSLRSDGGSCSGGGSPGVGGGGGGGIYGGGAGGTSSAGGGGGGGSSGFAPEATNTSIQTDTTGSPAVSIVYSPEPPAFGADPDVALTLAAKRIRARDPLAIRIANRNDFAISGQVSARRAKKGPGPQAQAAARPVSFDVDSEATEVVELKLPKRLRRELKRKGKLGLRLKATVEDPAGNTRTLRRTVRPKLKVPGG